MSMTTVQIVFEGQIPTDLVPLFKDGYMGDKRLTALAVSFDTGGGYQWRGSLPVVEIREEL